MEATAERKEGAGYPDNLDSLKLVRESSARPRLLAGPPFRSTLAGTILHPLYTISQSRGSRTISR